MALELNGTTGVSLVQDGVVTAADLASTLDLSGKTVTLPSGTGGKVLQVVQNLKTSAFSCIDWTTIQSVSITPSSSSSKILLMWTGSVSASQTANPVTRFTGGNSTAAVGDARGSRERTFLSGGNDFMYGAIADNTAINHTMIYLDSPNTTSAITYNAQGAIAEGGNGTFYCNRDGEDVASGEGWTGASVLIAMEISA